MICSGGDDVMWWKFYG